MDRLIRAGRVAGFALLVFAVGAGLRWATSGVIGAASTADLESMAVLGAAAVAWAAYAWFVLITVTTLLEAAPGVLGRAATIASATITSEASRQMLRSALGVAAVAPLGVAAAHAAPASHTAPADDGPRVHTVQRDWAPIEPPSSVTIANRREERASIERPSSRRLGDRSPARGGERIAVPDRPTVGAPTRYTEVDTRQQPRGRPRAVERSSPGRVVVRTGDSLWKIATDELGPEASDAEVARRWPQWYAANARVIGDDPDRLLPGQVLRSPAPGSEQSASAPQHPSRAVPKPSPTDQEK